MTGRPVTIQPKKARREQPYRTCSHCKKPIYRQALTCRQWQIASLIFECLTNEQIAVRLGISQQTVKNTITGIMHRWNEPDRVGIALRVASIMWGIEPKPEAYWHDCKAVTAA